jgi:hypothetical protein
MQAATCMECIPPGLQLAVQTYLLAQIAGGPTDAPTLIAQAYQFQNIPPNTLLEIQAYLLCQIVNK